MTMNRKTLIKVIDNVQIILQFNVTQCKLQRSVATAEPCPNLLKEEEEPKDNSTLVKQHRYHRHLTID